jgi:hypothetical protein
MASSIDNMSSRTPQGSVGVTSVISTLHTSSSLPLSLSFAYSLSLLSSITSLNSPLSLPSDEENDEDEDEDEEDEEDEEDARVPIISRFELFNGNPEAIRDLSYSDFHRRDFPPTLPQR